MSKFNSPSKAKAHGAGPMRTEVFPTTKTALGASGFVKDAKSELFLLAVSNLVSQDEFHETAKIRDSRFQSLIAQNAAEDFDWLFRMLVWLRSSGNMRSAALVGAVEAVRARLAAGQPKALESAAEAHTGRTNRALIAAVCQRADEPGEILAYWYGNYGKSVPQPIKRGIADAVLKLYNEKSLLKHDSDKAGIRFGDVVELTHPKAKLAWQNDLLRYAMDKHGRNEIPASLEMLNRRDNLTKAEMSYEQKIKFLKDNSGEQFMHQGALGQAGMTWESVAGWLQGPMTAEVWETIIPTMGYMALLRNLRNFDEAGVSDAVASKIIAKLVSPEEVAKSRQFPFRFWSAYSNTNSLRWGYALEQALNLSLRDVPVLDGRTLILVDRSPSMFPSYDHMMPKHSVNKNISRADQAAVFGSALALRAKNATLIEFGGQSRVMNVPKGGSVLKMVAEFSMISATDIPLAVKTHYSGHDRVIIVTDEQTRSGYFPSNGWGYSRQGMRETLIDDLVPKDVPVYMWNMAGYAPSATAVGKNRHLLGGLTDSAFSLIPILDSGRNGSWDEIFGKAPVELRG